MASVPSERFLRGTWESSFLLWGIAMLTIIRLVKLSTMVRILTHMFNAMNGDISQRRLGPIAAAAEDESIIAGNGADGFQYSCTPAFTHSCPALIHRLALVTDSMSAGVCPDGFHIP